MRHIVILAFALLASACSSSNGKDGAVLTAEAAIAKAKSSWTSVYEKTHSTTFSDESVRRFEPYTAVLADGVWSVQGTMPPDFHGEVPEATVRRTDGLTSVKGAQR